MKEIIKKIAVLALAGMMAVCLNACDSKPNQGEDNSNNSVADDSSSADDNSKDNNNIDNAVGDESAPPVNQNNNAETFKDYSNKSVENGKSIKWFWMDNGTEDILGDSDIFEVTFKIKDGVADGNYSIVVNDLAICNKDLEIIDAKIIDGVITVGSAQAPEQETASESAITVLNTSGNAGDEIKVKINFAKNPGFCTIQLGLNYDSSVLEPVNVVNTGILSEVGSVVMNLNGD